MFRTYENYMCPNLKCQIFYRFCFSVYGLFLITLKKTTVNWKNVLIKVLTRCNLFLEHDVYHDYPGYSFYVTKAVTNNKNIYRFIINRFFVSI